MWETIVVVLIVGIMAALTVRALYRVLSGKSDGCNCSTQPGPGGKQACKGCACKHLKDMELLEKLPVEPPAK